MRPFALQTLTWATVTAAVVSAFWLAAADLGWSEWRNPFNGDAVFETSNEPPQAGQERTQPTRESQAAAQANGRQR